MADSLLQGVQHCVVFNARSLRLMPDSGPAGIKLDRAVKESSEADRTRLVGAVNRSSDRSGHG
jgi:hypothetical protein